MASLLDSLANDLYKNYAGSADTNIQTFTLLGAWKFFIECGQKNRLVKYCLLSVEKKGDHYNVSQIMCRKVEDEYKPILINGEYVLSKKVKAYNLSDDMIKYMDGQKNRLMSLDTLKQ